MKTIRYRVLWADDQKDVQVQLGSLLPDSDFVVEFAHDGLIALSRLKQSDFDLLILDLKMPPGEWGGLWLLEQMQDSGIKLPSLVLSGEGSQRETIKALRIGATDYVTKDSARLELKERVIETVEKHGQAARLLERIKQGEDAEFECKETLRWNRKSNRFDKNIEHAIAKTISAFLNTRGGVLVVGVADGGDVVGLAQDQFKDEDTMLLHLDNLFQTFLSNTAATFVNTRFVSVSEKRIMEIVCARSSRPVFVLNGTDRDFYIRRQASSVKLPLDEAIDYIKSRVQ